MSSVANTSKLRIAHRFSNQFKINKRQSEIDFVDILLDTDIRLYIDPFALSVEEDDWSKECNDLVVGFFQELLDSFRTGNADRARSLLGNLHEPNETRLGQSSLKPQGRGVGWKQARDLYRAFAKSKAVETGLLTDLSDCELFIDGIGHDKVSDITTNIIRRKLVQFTKVQCHQHGVAMHISPTGPGWDPDRKHWRSTYDSLPVYRGYPLILVPKRSVRYVMAIDDRKFYEMEVLEFIRQNFNRAECLNPQSSLFKLLRAGIRVPKEQVKEAFPKTKEFLRVFSEEFPEVLARYKQAARRTAKWGAPSDSEIYELERRTAHSQGYFLIEEANIYMNTVHGDNFGAVGQGNRVILKAVSIYKSDVDASQTITSETKNLLKQSYDIIEATNLPDDDKNDAKENLQKLTDELNSEKNPGRISRLIVRLGQVVPAAAAVLKGGGEIVELVKQLPNPFAG